MHNHLAVSRSFRVEHSLCRREGDIFVYAHTHLYTHTDTHTLIHTHTQRERMISEYRHTPAQRSSLQSRRKCLQDTSLPGCRMPDPLRDTGDSVGKKEAALRTTCLVSRRETSAPATACRE
jgi:hypothetical protein